MTIISKVNCCTINKSSSRPCQ